MSKVSYGHDTSPVSTMKLVVNSSDSIVVADGPATTHPLWPLAFVALPLYGIYAGSKAVSQVVRASR